jgi:hypothetical protein
MEKRKGGDGGTTRVTKVRCEVTSEGRAFGWASLFGQFLQAWHGRMTG